MEKNIIKIQRKYRLYKLNNMINTFNQYELKVPKKLDFDVYTKQIRNRDIIKSVNNILDKLQTLLQKEINIRPQYILTAFLIKNFNEDILGPLKNRHPADIYMFQWSLKLVKIFCKTDNNYNDCKLLVSYLENYKNIFENWKTIDKNRTIQNIIVSYYHRQEHLEKIRNEGMNKELKDNIIKELIKESEDLLKNIIIIDKDFDIENLKINYKKIYEEIQSSMKKIYSSISRQFKRVYLEITIDEYKKGNNKNLHNLILDTNSRILKLCPQKYKESITQKLNKYDYIDIILNKKSVVKDYLEFLIDTILALSAPQDDNDNRKWKHNTLMLLEKLSRKYCIIVPTVLIEVNNKLDYIFDQINSLL